MQKNIENQLAINLLKLKKESKEKYDQALNIIEFLYKDIKEDGIDKIIDYHDAIYQTSRQIDKYEIVSRFNALKKELFSKFIESDDGVLDILFEMLNDEDNRFKDKFFESVEVSIDILKRKVSSSSSSYLYAFNIYTLLKAYEQNKDNYHNFEKILDDVVFLFIPNEEMPNISYTSNYMEKKSLIDSIVKIADYKELKSLQNLLKKVLNGITKRNSETEVARLNEMFNMYHEFYSDIRKLTRLGYNISEDLKVEIADDISLLVHDDLLPGIYPYYNGSLLLENRYKYFKEKIRVVNPHYRKEVFEFIKKLTPGIFENKIDETDSFEKYMDIVFDSDTYKELMNKLNVLKEAHDKYVSGNKDTSYLLDELSDKRHKDSFGKIIISYEGSSNNKIDKPNTIDKRMKNLYKKYDLVGEEFDFDEQKENLSSLISIIDEEILNYDIKKNNLNFPKSESQPVKKKGKFSIFG